MRAGARGALQRCGQISPEVFESFDPDRETDESVGEARLQACGRIHGSVSHGGRMRDETLDTAEGLREREAVEVGTEGPDGFVSSLDLHSDDGPIAALLAAGYFVARVGGESRIVDAPDTWLADQPLGESGSVAAVMLEPRVQRA